MESLVSPEAWIALLTLTALEIVLGIDNIIFISILVSRLPLQQRHRARVLGLGLAMMTRIASRRSGRGKRASTPRVDSPRLSVRTDPDRDHRHRVLARLGYHGDWHGRHHSGHGAGHRHRRRRDDVRGEADRRVHRPSSDNQDAGAVVSDSGRGRIDRRRIGNACSERLHLLRHGLFGRSGKPQPPTAQEERARPTAEECFATERCSSRPRHGPGRRRHTRPIAVMPSSNSRCSDSMS